MAVAIPAALLLLGSVLSGTGGTQAAAQGAADYPKSGNRFSDQIMRKL